MSEQREGALDGVFETAGRVGGKDLVERLLGLGFLIAENDQGRQRLGACLGVGCVVGRRRLGCGQWGVVGGIFFVFQFKYYSLGRF